MKKILKMNNSFEKTRGPPFKKYQINKQDSATLNKLKTMLQFGEYGGKFHNPRTGRKRFNYIIDNILTWCRNRKIHDSYLHGSSWTI